MFSSNTTQVSGGAYEISRSLRFNSADSANLSRTPATTTNRRTFTFSAWVKFSKTSDDPFLMGAGSGGQIWVFGDKIRVRLNGSPDYYYDTSAVFRDYSAWYHIVVGVDTTNATPADIVKIYVNSTRQAIGASSAPPQNFDTEFNLASTGNNLGKWPSGSQYLNGYMTEINFIDGQALTPSSFGETNAQTGVWQPKAYSGSYGTNGFYLNFSDNSNTTAATLGKDYSGNGNNWTPNGFLVSAGPNNDSLVDSPTSYGTDTGVGGTVRGNYATLNPLNAGNSAFITNGNLDMTSNTVAEWRSGVSTIAMSSGKWYAELTVNVNQMVVGIAQAQTSFLNNTFFVGNTPTSWGLFLITGQVYNNSAVQFNNPSFANGDILGLSFDADTGVMNWYKNGVASNNPVTGLTSGPYVFGFSVAYSGSASGSGSINFGQRPFIHAAPSGFKALCTQNLPTPTIGATTATTADKFFAPVLYTGTGSNLPVTVGFQPDWIWTKARSAVDNNVVVDVLRGIGNILITNNTAAESAYGAFVSFDANGFTKAAAESVNGRTYVAWNWKANGSGSTNTAGSITSTVSANTTSGFSIVTYTGTGANATVGHGLGVAPSMIIVKSRTLSGGHWTVYHTALGNTKGMLMNTTDSVYTNSGFWNNTNPTSTVFTVGTDGSVNQSSQNQVAYCFAEVAGYSKFGSYTGNGSTDGTFVYLGFRPAYMMIKASNAVDNWVIMDVARNPYNAVNYWLQAESSAAEATLTPPQFDFNSNGMKLRGTSSTCNGSGVTYIYMAFASNPFKYSLAR